MQSSKQTATGNPDEVELQNSLKPQRGEQAGREESKAKPVVEPESELQRDLQAQDAEEEKADTRAESESHQQDQVEREDPEPPFSVFSARERNFLVMMASLAALFSPLSANIYYPALNTLSTDLHVSLSKINLTITTYLVR